jgi:YD repeat-containing protein
MAIRLRHVRETGPRELENRLTSVTLPGTGIRTFKHDPFGRRIYKQSAGFTTIFVYDADNLLETLNASGSEIASSPETQKINDTSAEPRSSTTDYSEMDGLGSFTSASFAVAALGQ